MIQYRALRADELSPALFRDFVRRQVVTKCWRRENGAWTIKDAPFIDDWSEKDYQFLVSCLKNTIHSGGLVYAAFSDGKLKGFASVEPELFGGEEQYLDLSSLHVSQDQRHQGIGTFLFQAAADWARAHGGRKLYISSHSAAETQAFYQRMGCVDAALPHSGHVEAEPFDRQLECLL